MRTEQKKDKKKWEEEEKIGKRKSCNSRVKMMPCRKPTMDN